MFVDELPSTPLIREDDLLAAMALSLPKNSAGLSPSRVASSGLLRLLSGLTSVKCPYGGISELKETQR